MFRIDRCSVYADYLITISFLHWNFVPNSRCSVYTGYLIKISVIGTLSKIRFIQNVGVFRYRFKQVFTVLVWNINVHAL